MPGLEAREAALGALTAVFERQRALDPVFTGERWTALPPRDRAFARLLTLTVLRRALSLDAALDRFLKDPRQIPLRVRNILRLAAAQLLYLETGAHAAVNAATELAGRDAACRRHKGLVNAVARRMAEKAGALRAQVENISNTPPWLRERWEGFYGAGTVRAIEAAHLAEPPLHLTVKSDPEAWAERLGGTVLPTGSVALPAAEVTNLPGFYEGEWWVQDAAAALPVRLLGDVRGQEVYDLCAAPGGKTAQLAAAKAQATALDLSPDRLVRLRENLDRLGLDAQLVTADLLTWRPGTQASHVLLDAPCTSTGTIRRHPDIAWAKTPSDLVTLSILQADMLVRAAEFVAPGGTLVYCTCSLEPEEGAERIEALLAERPDFTRVPVTPEETGGLAQAITPEGDLRTLPCHLSEYGGMDGFYAARLRRV
ncbi:MAG: RsmB/NOP family class I SAM-dependent RNA methyltransferase [Alphaproteobacteria bacterium]